MAHAKPPGPKELQLPTCAFSVFFYGQPSVAAAWTNSSPWSILFRFDQSKPKITTCLSGFGGVLRLALSSSLIAMIKPTQLGSEPELN